MAQDGSITVSAHAGTTHLYKAPDAAVGASDFVVGYANQTINWRSTDGGSSWDRIGILPGIATGPHSATSSGFSDPDLAIDAGGRLYNTEINLPHVAVYSSPDDGQTWPTANPVASGGDRPWLVGAEADEVFVLSNLFVTRPLLRSTDGGLTFTVAHTNAPIDGKPIVDPLNPERGLIGPRGTSGFAISADDGKTWTIHNGANLGRSTQFFGTIAADRAGNVYMVAAGGYQSPDFNRDGEVTVAAFERATGQWRTVSRLPVPEGDALWPWITAGDEGRVAVGWLQELPGEPRHRFALYAGVTTNALGKTRCTDGTWTERPAEWAVANASGRAVHEGSICLNGTNCNLDRTSDRRLGDFITINHDLDGTIFLASGDTTLPSLTGGTKPVSNPIFVGQSTGSRLTTSPTTPRPTRCPFNVPVC